MGTLIDTSVWIDAFHSKTPVAIKQLTTAIINRPDVVLCKPVYVEFFRGVPEKETTRVESYLATVPMLSTPPALWRDAVPILRACWRNGTPVNILDVLIAVIALKHQAKVITFDQDFRILQELSGFSVEILEYPK